MGLKRCSLLCYLSQCPQAVYLESTTVGQNGMLPVHEFMQTTQGSDQFMTRSQVEVIGVPEYYLCPQVTHHFRCESLYRPLGSNGHENGRIHLSVRSRYFSKPRFRSTVLVEQCEIESTIPGLLFLRFVFCIHMIALFHNIQLKIKHQEFNIVLQYQHTIAVAVKPELFLDGLFIGPVHQIFTREGADKEKE